MQHTLAKFNRVALSCCDHLKCFIDSFAWHTLYWWLDLQTPKKINMNFNWIMWATNILVHCSRTTPMISLHLLLVFCKVISWFGVAVTSARCTKPNKETKYFPIKWKKKSLFQLLPFRFSPLFLKHNFPSLCQTWTNTFAGQLSAWHFRVNIYIKPLEGWNLKAGFSSFLIIVKSLAVLASKSI